MTSELLSLRAHTALRKPTASKRTGRHTGVYHNILPPSHLHMAVTLLLWRVQWYEEIRCALSLSLSPFSIALSYSLPSSSLPYHIPSCPVLFFWLNPILEFYHPVKSCILSSSTHFSVISQYRHLSLIFFSQYLFFIPFSPSSSPTPSISISSSSSSSSSSSPSSSPSSSSSSLSSSFAR